MSLGAGTGRPSGQPGRSTQPLAFRQQCGQRSGSAGSSPAPPGTGCLGQGELPRQRVPLRGRCQGGCGSPARLRPAGIFSRLLCTAGSEEKANSHLGLCGLGPVPALPHTPSLAA